MKFFKMSAAGGKKIIIAASIALLAASCQRGNPQNDTQPTPTPMTAPSPTPTPSTSSLNTYTSPAKYGFAIQYSADFAFTADKAQAQSLAYMPVCGDNMVACVYLKKDQYVNTNFDGGGVSVSIDPSLNTQAKCYNFAVSTSEAQAPVADAAINGTVFKSATGGGGAAGHFDKIQVYRNFRNGMCYEISQQMVETNIQNYDPGTVQQFDENTVWKKLQDVVNSFAFGASAANASFGSKVSLSGTTACLPHKNTGPDQPQTMECALGLKTDDGKYYGLKNSTTPFFDTGVKIKVQGTLMDDSSSNYDTAGAIEVDSLVKM